jgi:methylenetetrahydrofolate reductase (NADPH)
VSEREQTASLARRDPTAALRELALGYTIEVTPKEAAGVASLSGLLPPGSGVFITAIPGATGDQTVEAAGRIAAAGFHPIPHVAARAFPSLAEVDSFLGSLTAAAEITEILLIAGSLPRPAGAIDSTLPILRSELLERHGIRRVGVAGHPEGHPDLSGAVLAEALAEKNRIAVDSGLDVYIVTQFCFSPERYVSWEQAVRSAGNRLPVYAGLPGVTSIRTLLKFGISCGIGPSLRVLRKQARGFAALAGSGSFKPDALVAGIAEAVAADAGSLFRGLHFFPFGGLEDTVRWAEDIAREPVFSDRRDLES